MFQEDEPRGGKHNHTMGNAINDQVMDKQVLAFYHDQKVAM